MINLSWRIKTPKQRWQSYVQSAEGTYRWSIIELDGRLMVIPDNLLPPHPDAVGSVYTINPPKFGNEYYVLEYGGEMIYQSIARKLVQRGFIVKTGGDILQFLESVDAELRRLVQLLPSGGGLEPIRLDMGASNGDEIVFKGAFHLMNEEGFYDGWAGFTARLKPSLTDLVRLEIDFDDGFEDEHLGDHIHTLFLDALLADEEVAEMPRFSDDWEVK